MGFTFERDTSVVVKRGKRALPIDPDILAAVNEAITTQDWRVYRVITLNTEKTGAKRSAKILAGIVLRDLRKIAKANRESDETVTKYRYSISDAKVSDDTHRVQFAVWPVTEVTDSE